MLRQRQQKTERETPEFETRTGNGRAQDSLICRLDSSENWSQKGLLSFQSRFVLIFFVKTPSRRLSFLRKKKGIDTSISGGEIENWRTELFETDERCTRMEEISGQTLGRFPHSTLVRCHSLRSGFYYWTFNIRRCHLWQCIHQLSSFLLF